MGSICLGLHVLKYDLQIVIIMVRSQFANNARRYLNVPCMTEMYLMFVVDRQTVKISTKLTYLDEPGYVAKKSSK